MNANKITKILNFNIVPFKEEYIILILCLINSEKPMLLYAKTPNPHFELSQWREDYYTFNTYSAINTEIKLNCPLFGETKFKLFSLDDIENKKVSKKELEKLIGCDII